MARACANLLRVGQLASFPAKHQLVQGTGSGELEARAGSDVATIGNISAVQESRVQGEGQSLLPCVLQVVGPLNAGDVRDASGDANQRVLTLREAVRHGEKSSDLEPGLSTVKPVACPSVINQLLRRLPHSRGFAIGGPRDFTFTLRPPISDSLLDESSSHLEQSTSCKRERGLFGCSEARFAAPNHTALAGQTVPIWA